MAKADTVLVDVQLEAMAGLDRALEGRQIPYWLFGGWAVDFWVGRVTRPHLDIDVVAWRRDYDAVREALVAAGWEHAPLPDDLVGTRFRWRLAEVEFTFVDTSDGADVVIPFPGQPVVWSTKPLGEVRRELRGVSCRTIPLELLLTGKSSPRADAVEGAKDRADFAALSTRTAADDPV